MENKETKSVPEAKTHFQIKSIQYLIRMIPGTGCVNFTDLFYIVSPGYGTAMVSYQQASME
jgi:hypothetical protein